jgi:PAS domain S-box-containing protein
MRKEFNVLLVEDNPNEAELIVSELRKGWQRIRYERVNCASEMRDMLCEEDWDIIISDYLRQDFTGIDGLEIVKDSGIDIPFIMILGETSESLEASVMNAGADGYVLKSALYKLVPVIERALAEKWISNRHTQFDHGKLERYQEAVFYADSSIVLYERRGLTRNFTNNIMHILGWSSEELANGEPLFEDQVHPLDKPAIRHKYQRWIRGGKVGILYLWYRIRHRDGRTIWLEERMRWIRKEGGLGITTGLLIDNTELKTTERDLKRSERNLSKAQMISHIGSFVSVLPDKNIQISVELYKILEMEEGTKVLKQEYEDFIYSEDLVDIRNYLHKCFIGKKHLISHEFRIITAVGNIRAVSMQAELHWEGSILQSVEGTIWDITERRRSEEKLRRTVIELENTQKKMIQMETMAALGEFASGIAHEIRNPLANISSSVQYIIKKFQPAHDMMEFLDLIKRNSDNANFIIRELLEFARPRDLSLEPYNILTVIDTVCELTNAKCLENKVEIKKVYPVEIPEIEIDIELMKRAILNLIMNAIEAMKNGGRLTVRAERDGDIIIIYICDTGMGITKKDIKKVFNPFFSKKEYGVGLGLSLTHRIISLHQGTIEVKSQYKKGATFIVKLPIYECNTAENRYQ